MTTRQRHYDERDSRPLALARGGRAFTLVELIIVMMLIGTIMALAAPTLHGFLSSRQTADAALTALALTQWCRSDAIAQGRRTRLNLDADGHNFFVTVEKAGDFVAPETEIKAQMDLPEGAKAALRPASAGQMPGTFIQFYPNGRSDAATIAITGKQGDLYLLTSAAPTEAYRVVTPAEGSQR